MKKLLGVFGLMIFTATISQANIDDSTGFNSVKIISGNQQVNAIDSNRTQYDFTCNEFHGDFKNGSLMPNSSEVCIPSEGTYGATLPIDSIKGAMCSISLEPSSHMIVFGVKGCPMAQEYKDSVYSIGDEPNRQLVIDFSKIDK